MTGTPTTTMLTTANKAAPVVPITLNCKISSDIEELERLHALYGWVPGQISIRPIPESKIAKEKYLQTIRECWNSETDYVLATVFGFAPSQDPVTSKFYVANQENLPQRKIFDKQAFPYQVPQGTHHSLMWYTHPPEGGDEQIAKDIFSSLEARLAGRKFAFVYYHNPKKTIPFLHHVQVFWTTNI